jgi:hypothetical protein
VYASHRHLSHCWCLHDRLKWGHNSTNNTAAISPIDSEQQQQQEPLSILSPEQLAEQFSAQIEAALQSPPHAISMITPPLSPLTTESPFNNKRQSRGHFKYEVSNSSSSNSSKSILSSVRRVLLGSPQARIGKA